MKYPSFVDFYRTIRQQSHALALTQRNGVGATMTAKSFLPVNDANVAVAEFPMQPDNLREMVLAVDEAMMRTTLDNLDENKQFKPAFVTLSIILHNSYRGTIKMQRRKSVSALRGNKTTDESDSKEAAVTSSAQQARTPKVTREQCIPEVFDACRSNVAKAAVALYCMNGIRGITRRNILYHALAGQIETVAKTVRLMTQIRQDPTIVRNIVFADTPSEKVYPMLVQTLLELAEFTRDKSPAKLAALISEPVYMLAMRHFLERNVFDSIYPYEPLIARYLHDCVAPINVAREQATINNQFKLDPTRTMTYLLENIPDATRKALTRSGGVGGANSRVARFDDEQTYEVFVGPLNYIHNVMITYVPYEGRNYRTITYNDCLYDVVGCSMERTEAGVTTRDSILYDNMRWSERLALLPYRAKIKLVNMTGAELNAFRGTASLTVSWFERNHECSKTVTCKSGGKKDAEATDDGDAVASEMSVVASSTTTVNEQKTHDDLTLDTASTVTFVE